MSASLRRQRDTKPHASADGGDGKDASDHSHDHDLLIASMSKVEGAVAHLYETLVDHKDPNKLLLHAGITIAIIQGVCWCTDNAVGFGLLVYAVWHFWIAAALRPAPISKRQSQLQDQKRRANAALEGVAVVLRGGRDIVSQLQQDRQKEPLMFYGKTGLALLVLYKLFGYLSGATLLSLLLAGWLTYASGVDVFPSDVKSSSS